MENLYQTNYFLKSVDQKLFFTSILNYPNNVPYREKICPDFIMNWFGHGLMSAKMTQKKCLKFLARLYGTTSIEFHKAKACITNISSIRGSLL